MENLNKLSFYNRKINEQAIHIPMGNIRQEFDVNESIRPYLFRVVYVHKYHSPTDTFIVYLAPMEQTDLPIIKAQLPLDLLYTHKIIGSYNYDRPLDEKEAYIVKDKIFRLVTKINNGARYYLLCYGYLVNRYKNDDANTKKETGVQEFNFTEIGKQKFADGANYESYHLYHKNLIRLYKIMIKCRSREMNIPSNISKENLTKLAENFACSTKFKKLPKEFFVDK